MFVRTPQFSLFFFAKTCVFLQTISKIFSLIFTIKHLTTCEPLSRLSSLIKIYLKLF